MSRMVTAEADDTTARSRAPGIFAGLAPRLTELALVVVFGAILARILWFVMFGSSADRFDLDIAPAPVASSESGSADLSGLVDGGVFAAGSKPVVLQQAEALPETRLNLVLRGVRPSAEPSLGSATIDIPNQGQRVLTLGSEIAPGIFLSEIYPDRIVIDRNGTMENLFLREEDARRRQAALEAEQQAGSQPPARFTAQQWVNGLALERIEGESGIQGYRVSGSSDPALLEGIGLLVGDVLIELNGRSLERSVNTFELLEELGEAERLQIVFRRDGAQQSVEMELR